MAKIEASPDLGRIKGIEDLQRFLSTWVRDCHNVVNGSLEFGKNIIGTTSEVTFSAANTDTRIAHGLGRAPTGYLIIGQSASGSIYDGVAAADSTYLYLRASAAMRAKIIVI